MSKHEEKVIAEITCGEYSEDALNFYRSKLNNVMWHYGYDKISCMERIVPNRVMVCMVADSTKIDNFFNGLCDSMYEGDWSFNDKLVSLKIISREPVKSE